jgi:hypothetical protein
VLLPLTILDSNRFGLNVENEPSGIIQANLKPTKRRAMQPAFGVS